MMWWLLWGFIGLIGLHELALRYYAAVTARNALNVPMVSLPPPAKDASRGERVQFNTRDGATLTGYWIPADDASPRVIIFCHQTGADWRTWERFASGLPLAGFHVFSFTFRGLTSVDVVGSRSERSERSEYQWPSEGEINDVLGAVQYVKGRMPASRLGILSVSKGGPAAVAAATQTSAIEALVVDSLFSTIDTLTISMRRWARLYVKPPQIVRWVPQWLYRRVARMALPRANRLAGRVFFTVEPYLKRLRQPLLVIHNGADPFVDEPSIRRLLSLGKGARPLFWEVAGAGHAEASQRDPTAYQRRLIEFFSRHLAAPDLVAAA